MRGVVHGKTIELEQAPGLPDGQPVDKLFGGAHQMQTHKVEGHLGTIGRFDRNGRPILGGPIRFPFFFDCFKKFAGCGNRQGIHRGGTLQFVGGERSIRDHSIICGLLISRR